VTPKVDPQSPRFIWNAVCIDCAPGDFENVVAFYRDMLQMPVYSRDDGWAAMGHSGGGMDISVQAEDWYVRPVWPEQLPQPAKMMHFEIRVDNVEAAVARAIECGASEASPQPADRDPSKLRVMLDPAGHPFCLWS
jgi:catechol 2,3-dioxygenase-like lactoylglutathione lyase family enzyme